MVRVDGAVMSVGADPHRSVVVSAAGECANRLANLQFTLGEGPKVDALESGEPVLTADVTTESFMRRWPVFAPAATKLGIRAIFALPLNLADALAGVLQLYRTEPGQATDDELAAAQVAGNVGLDMILDVDADADSDGDDEWVTGIDLGERAIVYQATGAVAADFRTSLDDALLRLKFYAYSHDLDITDVAQAVMNGELDLDHDG
jgi:hypothetical protein